MYSDNGKKLTIIVANKVARASDREGDQNYLALVKIADASCCRRCPDPGKVELEMAVL